MVLVHVGSRQLGAISTFCPKELCMKTWNFFLSDFLDHSVLIPPSCILQTSALMVFFTCKHIELQRKWAYQVGYYTETFQNSCFCVEVYKDTSKGKFGCYSCW